MHHTLAKPHTVVHLASDLKGRLQSRVKVSHPWATIQVLSALTFLVYKPGSPTGLQLNVIADCQAVRGPWELALYVLECNCCELLRWRPLGSES